MELFRGHTLLVVVVEVLKLIFKQLDPQEVLLDQEMAGLQILYRKLVVDFTCAFEVLALNEDAETTIFHFDEVAS